MLRRPLVGLLCRPCRFSHSVAASKADKINDPVLFPTSSWVRRLNDTIAERIEQIYALVVKLDTKTDVLQSKITRLGDKLNTLESNVDGIKHQVESLKFQVETKAKRSTEGRKNLMLELKTDQKIEFYQNAIIFGILGLSFGVWTYKGIG